MVDRLIPAGDGPGALGRAPLSTSTDCSEPSCSIHRGSGLGDRRPAVSVDRRDTGNFHKLSALDEQAWRTRIEGSLGIPEREFNGPVAGFQQRYREGLAALGEDFSTCEAEERVARLRANRAFTSMVFTHVCEGTYGAPEYGGNRDQCGWEAIDFAGDVQPRGWTDAEVSEP